MSGGWSADRGRHGRSAGWAFALAAVCACSAWAAGPIVEPLSVSPEDFLTRAATLEQDGLLQQAADLYERAVRLYPDHDGLRERWVRAERRFSLTRRYCDRSFQAEMLALDEARALELYREVVRKIEAYYVTPVPPRKLAESGRQALQFALAPDSAFLQKHGGGLSATTLAELRQALADRPAVAAEAFDDLTAEVREACAIARRHGFVNAPALVLEYVAAAGEGLDAYSAHLTPDRLRELYSSIDGNFVGLGVEVRGCADGLEVACVLEDSPAAEAGLQERDVLLAIDGLRLAGQPAELAANRLLGKAGAPVRLAVRRGAAGTRELQLVRREVAVRSVQQPTLVEPRDGIGYLRLASFQKHTAQELDAAVAELRQRGLRALVVDVRGNPGGLLEAAVQVANRFVGDGLLVRTEGRAWGQTFSHHARPGAVWDFPVAVLIDGDSASASEILAGALQGHGRAKLVGTRTYGKGSVQSIFPLRAAGTGLRLTTARFYGPSGRPYDRVGVAPDVAVRRPSAGRWGEESPPPRQPEPMHDPQLAAALRLLAPMAETARR